MLSNEENRNYLPHTVTLILTLLIVVCSHCGQKWPPQVEKLGKLTWQFLLYHNIFQKFAQVSHSVVIRISQEQLPESVKVRMVCLSACECSLEFMGTNDIASFKVSQSASCRVMCILHGHIIFQNSFDQHADFTGLKWACLSLKKWHHGSMDQSGFIWSRTSVTALRVSEDIKYNVKPVM